MCQKKQDLVRRLKAHGRTKEYKWCVKNGEKAKRSLIFNFMKREKEIEARVDAEFNVKSDDKGIGFEALKLEDSKAEQKRTQEAKAKRLEEEKTEAFPEFEGFSAEGLSDLCEGDVPDSDISDVDLEDLRAIEEEAGPISKEMLVQLRMAEESQRKDKDFSEELLKRYTEDPDAAKAFYYKEKEGIDVDTEEGKS